jgi:hypothetical protein
MIYVERRTQTKDGEVIVRDPVPSVREALIKIYGLMCDGFYNARNQHSQIVCAQEGTLYPPIVNPASMMYPAGLFFSNDLGGHTLVCWNEYTHDMPVGVSVKRGVSR